MDKKTILLMGGCGFIGSNFIHYLFENYNNIKVINVDKLTYAGNPENIKSIIEKYSKGNDPFYYFYKADITDKKALVEIFDKYKIDYVINFAAESHVDRSIENPRVFLETNIVGTEVLCSICLKNSIKKFIQISTDEVYGSLGETGCFTEDSPIEPNSPYAASKASADLIVRAYVKTYGAPFIITRCSNNYGPYQFPEKLIPLMINNAINLKPLPVYGDGLNVRDWIYVEDHCRAIATVLDNGKNGVIYNIGGGNECTNIDLVKNMLTLLVEKERVKRHSILKGLSDLNRKGELFNLITFVKDRPGHDKRYAMDSSYLQRELQFSYKYSLKEALGKTVDWYLENVDWLRSVITREYLQYYSRMYDVR